MKKKLFIITLIFITISMIVTCEPSMPKTDYRIATIKNTYLGSTEDPKPYSLKINQYLEEDHLYWRASETKDDDGITTKQVGVQQLNENGFPTKQIITYYSNNIPEEEKEFIDFVYDETLFLPTSIIKYDGLDDVSKVKINETYYTYNDKGLLLSVTRKDYDDDEKLEKEFTLKNLIPQNTKKIYELMLTNVMDPEIMSIEFMGIFFPSSQKNYNTEGELSYESIMTFDDNDYPTTIVQTNYTENPPIITTIYLKVTLEGGKLSLIELFEDSAYTTPIPTENYIPSKIAYTYNSENLISQIDVYFYSESTHTIMQKMVYDWIGFPIKSRHGNMIAYTISEVDGTTGTALEDSFKLEVEWTSDLILVLTISEQGKETKGLVKSDESMITFSIVDVE